MIPRRTYSLFGSRTSWKRECVRTREDMEDKESRLEKIFMRISSDARSIGDRVGVGGDGGARVGD